MTYVITRSCCNDASCVEVCPVDCIHPAPDEPGFGSAEMLYIHPDECIDCGACQEACPVEAVYPDFELPEHLESYLLVNAAYFDWTGEQPEPEPLPSPGPPVTGQKGPLKVAVVGAGPAGWYVADELAQTRRCDVEVTVMDRLPTPYGLVRYGVAPDHLDTKRIVDGFARTAAHRRVTTRYNVEVGRDITHEELTTRHHAVVYTTGASEGRALGILGESLPGSVAAAEVVGWYNGHPDRASLQVPLDHERAIVIGNGNVALDLARVLLASPEKLATGSDLAPHALEALSAGSIEEVVVVGRRGPEHAAFTGPELQALADLPDLDVVVDPADLEGLPAEADIDERSAETFAAVRKAELLRELAARPRTGARRLVLRFGLTPQQVLGEHTVTGLRLAPTAGGDPVDLEAGLVIRATGYRSAGVEGVPLDERGRIPHASGRVVGAGGTYTAGWAKRGPSGVIGTNRADAAETVRTLLDDYAAGSLADPAEDVEPLDELLAARGVTIVDQSGWAALDSHEKETGKEAGRPRVKVTDRAEQLHIAAAKSAKWVADHVKVRRPHPA